MGAREVFVVPLGLYEPNRLRAASYTRVPLFIDSYLVLSLVEVELVGHLGVLLLRRGAHGHGREELVLLLRRAPLVHALKIRESRLPYHAKPLENGSYLQLLYHGRHWEGRSAIPPHAGVGKAS